MLFRQCHPTITLRPVSNVATMSIKSLNPVRNALLIGPRVPLGIYVVYCFLMCTLIMNHEFETVSGLSVPHVLSNSYTTT